MSCHFITNVWHQCSFLTKNCVLAHFTLDRYEEKNDLDNSDNNGILFPRFTLYPVEVYSGDGEHEEVTV